MTKLDFSSDTAAPAHPQVLRALSEINESTEPSYGADSATQTLRKKIEVLFETAEVFVWPTHSGTSANALALSLFCPPTGSIICHEEAHIQHDERGAPEFFSGGGKLNLLSGQHAQIDEERLNEALQRIDRSFVHETPPHVLSMTNLTERGTVYDLETVAKYARLAKNANLMVHLDGARLANALVSLKASPADATWRSGVDVLTLGFTKTGAIGCELIILFGDAQSKSDELLARAKRSGHMPAKMRYLSAQANAMLTENLWLELAGQANQRAKELSTALSESSDISLACPVQGNEVFVSMPNAIAKHLWKQGVKFYRWLDGSYRFVCSWQTSKSAIDELSERLQKLNVA